MNRQTAGDTCTTSELNYTVFVRLELSYWSDLDWFSSTFSPRAAWPDAMEDTGSIGKGMWASTSFSFLHDKWHMPNPLFSQGVGAYASKIVHPFLAQGLPEREKQEFVA